MKRKSIKLKIMLFLTPGLLLFLLFGMLLMLVTGGGDNSGFGDAQEPLAGTGFELVGVSEKVLKWRGSVTGELEKYGKSEYTNLVLAIMMQESGGRVNDVLQASESIGQKPNSITNPEYSIEVGVKYIAALLDKKERLGADLETFLQSYNYGTGFMDYVMKNGGKYTKELAVKFSDQQAAQLGWKSYGDKKYVEHVRRYLTEEKNSMDAGDGIFGRPVEDPEYRKKVNMRFGTMTGSMSGRKPHSGTDFPYPAGTQLYAVADGTVTAAYNQRSWGNNVAITTQGGSMEFRYAHMTRYVVAKGDTVKKGQLIGYVGNTGYSFGAHLHLELKVNGVHTDCLNYLP